MSHAGEAGCPTRMTIRRAPFRGAAAIALTALQVACSGAGPSEPPADAGSCVPAVAMHQSCEAKLSALTFCATSEAAQAAAFCADAGVYERTVAACDGGVRYVELVTGLGPTQGCVYVDGGLVGGSSFDDTNQGFAAGRWALPDCAPRPPSCP